MGVPTNFALALHLQSAEGFGGWISVFCYFILRACCSRDIIEFYNFDTLNNKGFCDLFTLED